LVPPSITAAGVLVAGSVAAWIIGLAKGEGKSDEAASAIVVTGSGKAVCGALAAGEGNSPLRLVDEENQTLLDLSTGVASLTVVDSCPEPR
jgi:hypothetical protein